jgi:glycosyltransferase involved in cell wall biosynthesis
VAEETAKIPVSGYMITFNNARTVEKALKSLSWVDELVVVDSFSTDGTAEIAKRCGAKVVQRPWPGFRDQYQFAADQCSHEWVIFADADEEVTPELVLEIKKELARNAARPEAERIRGYLAHRITFFLGRWIRHGGWAPASDAEIRLYHKASGKWLGDLHATPRINGPTTHFKHLYNHYSYANISELVKKVDSYSTIAAGDDKRNGKRASFLKLATRPAARFVRDYFFKLGFLDGFPGLLIALNTAYYVAVKQSKLWELERSGEKETKA